MDAERYTHLQLHVEHASPRDRSGAGLLEFAMSEPGIICELIADGHHVSPTLMKMLYRAKKFHCICLVTDATAGAGLKDGSKFSLYGTSALSRKASVCSRIVPRSPAARRA